MAAKRKSRRKGIKVKSDGSLRRATKTKKGAKIPMSKLRRLKKRGTPAQKKKANFAINARGWKKGRKKR